MKPLEYVEKGLAYATDKHVWFVPMTILLVSHFIFSGAGLLGCLVSAALSVTALTYHKKYSNE
jgi:hypothetical protein